MPSGWDHDPPAKEKLVPFGILTVATGAWMLLVGRHETSDAWADALWAWWLKVRSGHESIRRLVIYLDNGPKVQVSHFWGRLTDQKDMSVSL